MGDGETLARAFESHRAHLRGVAWRMLGSLDEAEEAVQEAWLRLDRADAAAVDNLGGWLTTVVARLCLDRLRARRTRREEPLEPATAAAGEGRATAADPEREALLADAVGVALVVVLDRLTPAERVAFVLHDLFDFTFEEIAPIVGRSPVAARQLASRARRRVRDAPGTRPRDLERQRALLDAFLAASRGGDLAALLALLDPEVVLRADAATVAMGASPELRGADAVAATFARRAQGARPALVDGALALVWAAGGRPRVIFELDFAGDRIAAIRLVADPRRLAAAAIRWLGAPRPRSS